MKRRLIYTTALLAVLAACGQKDNVTPHAQPGPAQPPQPLTGEPQAATGGGKPVYPGNAPVTPGGAPAPGEGVTPDQAPASGSAPSRK